MDAGWVPTDLERFYDVAITGRWIPGTTRPAVAGLLGCGTVAVGTAEYAAKVLAKGVKDAAGTFVSAFASCVGVAWGVSPFWR